MKWMLNAYGDALYFSPEWLEFTGLNEVDVIGKRPSPAVHPEDAETVAELLRDAARSTSPFLLTFRLRRSDKRYVWVMAGGSPAFGPADGELLGYLGTTKPIEQTNIPLYVRDILKSPPALTRDSAHKIVLLDAIADYITMARYLTNKLNNEKLKKSVDNALLTVGDIIYKTIN